MPSDALKAHFDGERIVLDERADLAPNTRLLITVLPEVEAEKSMPSKAPPRVDFAARLKAIYGDYVMPDEEFDELLRISRGGVDDDLR